MPGVTDGETGVTRTQGVETGAGKADSSNRLKFTVTSYNDFRTGVTVSRFC